jgi:hypothetical protein
MSAVASNDCPVRSIHLQPVSLVQPFLPPGHHRFEGGLEDTGFGDPAAAAAATGEALRGASRWSKRDAVLVAAADPDYTDMARP